MERRLGLVREVLDRRGASHAFLSARRNFSWLTAGGVNHIVLATEAGEGGLLVSRGDAVCIAPNIEARRLADEELDGLGIGVEAVDWWRDGGIAAAAPRRARDQVLTDADMEADLEPLRSVLAPLDRDRLAILGREGTKAVEAALDEMAPGVSEAELVTDLVCRLGDMRAPVLLCAADDRIVNYRHPLPSRMPIRRRVMLILVGERWGLHVAVTRFRELEPLSDDLAARFAAVTEVQAAIHQATQPGATLGDAFAAGQAAYARAGFPNEWQLHHQGGTIAYRGRERVATPADPTRIEAGMAFAWNPSITGAKVEETFILGEDGRREVVTQAD
ncbi:MAG TPA: M24 family metallopeptidase [Candidatus Limnocylindrales bacterium]|nr:M24 family metallopeptidase [Candidatus Limnocylindrales bacterium]